MKVSAQITFAMSVAFALLCLGYGAYGWHELAGMAPGPERDDANGYVLFWGFLGAIGAICAAIAWRMMRGADR